MSSVLAYHQRHEDALWGQPGGWMRWLTALWLGALVVLPLGLLAVRGVEGGPLEVLHAPYAVSALVLTVWTAAVAAAVNAVMGTATAWVLVRTRVRGRELLSSLVDLPFAIPTLVAGLVVVQLLGPSSPTGALLARVGLPVAFAPLGIAVVLTWITLPFVVRAVEPVLADLDPAVEEAAATLGASRWTVLRRVILPSVLPAVAAGAVQSFARGLAEFGSVVVVSGNIPGRTLTAPVWIYGEVEAGRLDQAAALAVVLLVLALAQQPLARMLRRRAP